MRKPDIAMLKSVIAVKNAYREIKRRKAGVPGMALIYGKSGCGKTTAVQLLREETQALYVRAVATDTPVSLLSSMVQQTGVTPNSTRGLRPMVEAIADYLDNNDLPLFVDECDHLLANKKLIETIRDIHDLSDAPTILIGHDGLERRFGDKLQLLGRISHWLNIPPADLDDAEVLARTVCSVKVKQDLLEDLHRHCQGIVRLMVVGLTKIDAAAKSIRADSMDLESFGRRKYFVNQLARSL